MRKRIACALGLSFLKKRLASLTTFSGTGSIDPPLPIPELDSVFRPASNPTTEEAPYVVNGDEIPPLHVMCDCLIVERKRTTSPAVPSAESVSVSVSEPPLLPAEVSSSSLVLGARSFTPLDLSSSLTTAPTDISPANPADGQEMNRASDLRSSSPALGSCTALPTPYAQLQTLPIAYPMVGEHGACTANETIVGSGIGVFSTITPALPYKYNRVAMSREWLGKLLVLLRPHATGNRNEESEKDCWASAGPFKLLHSAMSLEGHAQCTRILASMLDSAANEALQESIENKSALVDVGAILDAVSTRHLTWLLLAFLLEQKVIIVSSKLTALLTLCEWLKQTIRPLAYCPTYAPTVCSSVSALMLQCPTPYCLGWHVAVSDGDSGAAAAAVSKHIQTMLDDSHSCNEVLFLDMDNDQCSVPACMTQFLPSVAEPLVQRVRRVQQSKYFSLDSRSIAGSCGENRHPPRLTHVTAIFQEFIYELLVGVDECAVSRIATDASMTSIHAQGVKFARIPGASEITQTCTPDDVVILFNEQLFHHIKRYRRIGVATAGAGICAPGFIDLFCRTQALSEYICANSK